MKNILKSLLCGCVVLSTASICVDASDFPFPNISMYSVNAEDLKKEEELVLQICDRWILSKKMHYAGKETNKGGWVNGCMHLNRKSNRNEYESWKTSFDSIRNILVKVLVKREVYDFSSIDMKNDPNAPEYRNAYWLQQFVISSVKAIKNSSNNVSLNNIKNTVLKAFYDNSDLKKDESSLHDMHSYIGALDIFNMTVTAMRVSMTLKNLPEYEKRLYNTNTKTATQAINFNNGYLNCYLTSFFQIINALDKNQIDDDGLLRLQTCIRNYNKDYLDDKTPKDSNGKLDPRGLFDRMYKDEWNVFSQVVNEISNNAAIKENQAVKELLTFYDSEKEFMEQQKENEYSPYDHINSFHEFRDLLKEYLKYDNNLLAVKQLQENELLFDKIKSLKNSNMLLKTIMHPYIENGQSLYDINEVCEHIVDTFIQTLVTECRGFCKNIYNNATQFNRCDKIFLDNEKEIKVLTKEQKKVIEKFIKLRKIQNFVYSCKYGESIGDFFSLISSYFDIYPTKIRDLVRGYYRTSVDNGWISLRNDDRFEKREEFKEVVNCQLTCTQDSDNLLSHNYEKAVNICADLIKDSSDLNQVKNIDTVLNIILYLNDEVFTLGWTTEAPKFLDPKEKSAVKKDLSNKIIEQIRKGIPREELLKENWWYKITNALSEELPILIGGKQYRYKVKADEILNKLKEIKLYKNFEEIDTEIKAKGLVVEDNDGIKDILKSSYVCATVKECPNVIFANYENTVQSSVRYAKNLTRQDYLYTINANGEVSFYKLIGFCNYYPGHYNVSVFSGISNADNAPTDENGWQNVDSYFTEENAGVEKNENYKGKYSEEKSRSGQASLPVFFAWQKIFSDK